MVLKKLFVVGDGAQGKTSLLTVLCEGRFPEDYVPYVYEPATTIVETQGKEVEFTLFDVAGGEEYVRLRPLSYPNTDVFLLLYGIDNHLAFNDVTDVWVPELQHHCPGVPIILVGSKKDLRIDPETLARLEQKGQKPLSEEDGHAMAQRIGAAAFMECSAKLNEGVKDLFETAASVCLRPKRRQGWRGRCECL